MSDGTIVITGKENIEMFALISWRSAMGLELRTGMKVSRGINIKTIIPALVARGITDVQAPYSQARKVKAYNDLNAFLVAHDAQDKPLDLPAKSK